MLTLAAAQSAIADILRTTASNARKPVIAIVDSHGELIALARTDGAALTSLTLAINKAYTAARAARTSEELGKKVNDPANKTPLAGFGDPRLTGVGGGVPIYNGATIIGAVGISGLTEPEDIELATNAAAQLSQNK